MADFRMYSSMDDMDENVVENELQSNGFKKNSPENKSPRSPLSHIPPENKTVDMPMEGAVDTSIERLYHNVCEMQSSYDGSPSRLSLGSDGEESRIDSELCHLVGGEMRELEILQGEVDDRQRNDESKMLNGSIGKKIVKKPSLLQPNSDVSHHSSSPNETSFEKSSVEKQNHENSRTPGPSVVKRQRNILGASKFQNGSDAPSEMGLDNRDLGPFLLNTAREMISSGDNLHKALDIAHRAAKSFEICANGKPSLDLVMSLHIEAAIHCSLGHHSRAIPILEHSVTIPVLEEGQDHALAKFSGYMQLGDTYAMLGHVENSIKCYTIGLEIQMQTLGETDIRVGETCRYLAEAHVQALQFDEAQKLCQLALEIHKVNGDSATLEEIADRRLMGLICVTKGDHEGALEHLVLVSMAMVSNGQEKEVAYVDCSIGDTYLSLARYDEAIFAYQKALNVFKSTKGENHPTVASVFVRLADLYNKTGKLRESRSYCENALRIYEKPPPGNSTEDIANGFINVSAIYESMNEPEQALKLLKKALKMYGNIAGQQNTIAGIEAQMGVLYYMIGNYNESYSSLTSATMKLRESSEKKSALFGIALNQMGLACVQRYAINEAAALFEEARNILEVEYGPYHPDTLGVYSNLAGIYDAMGRLNDAIEILEYIVGIRENKLGTANPDVNDEKRRLSELLKEAGRVRNRKAKSLETLFDSKFPATQREVIKV